MAVELRQLRYFAAVANAAQVSRAARQLHIAQPALSQALRGSAASSGAYSSPSEGGRALLANESRGASPFEPHGATPSLVSDPCPLTRALDRAMLTWRFDRAGRVKPSTSL
jgi:hypothetical protein